MDEAQPKRRPPISQLSKTPSWVMLGFILGALFVSALPRKNPPVPKPIVLAPPEVRKADEKGPPRLKPLQTIEAVFPLWAHFAVWENETTQVALWDVEIGQFADFYEVRRVGDIYFYRTIPALTNRLLTHGAPLPPNCPLRFTESEEHYRQWVEQGRSGGFGSGGRPRDGSDGDAPTMRVQIIRPEAPRVLPTGVSTPHETTPGAGQLALPPFDLPKKIVLPHEDSGR